MLQSNTRVVPGERHQVAFGIESKTDTIAFIEQFIVTDPGYQGPSPQSDRILIPRSQAEKGIQGYEENTRNQKVKGAPYVRVNHKEDAHDFAYTRHRTWAPFGSGFDYGVTETEQGNTYLYGNTVSGYIGNAVDAHPTFGFSSRLAEIEDRAMGKIYEQLRGSNANLAVDVAESAATLKMLRNVTRARNLFEVIERAAKRRRTNSRSNRTTDWVSGKWLEYRYGWIPLISSTYDLMDVLFNDFAKFGKYRVFARSSAEQVETRESRPGGTHTVNTLLSETVRFNEGFQVGLNYKNIGSGVQQLANYTSLNPLGIAWELLPFSFVADWFVNVGDWLDAWENYALFESNFESKGSFQTYKSHTTCNKKYVKSWKGEGPFRNEVPVWTLEGEPRWEEGTGGTLAIGRIGENLSWTSRFETLTVRRLRRFSAPIPNAPRFKPNLNAKRFVDAAALFKLATSRVK